MPRPHHAALCALLLSGCGHPLTPPPAPAASSRLSAHSGKGTPLHLVDITEEAGVRFHHNTGAAGRKWFPETNGSGVAIFDVDGDGNPDLFLVNGRSWGAECRAAHLPPPADTAPTPSALYRNLGNGRFEEITHTAGVDVPMYGMGCAVGDFDNDGWPDLYVSGVGRGWLFHNEGGKRFTEVAQRTGVMGGGWGSSCAWVDYDRDGRLDLFVGHYVEWSPRNDSPCDGPGGRKVYCAPNLYHAEQCRLYRQGADGHFQDVSEAAGLWGKPSQRLKSKAMGVAVLDVDGDGWPDLAVANDTAPNFLFRNNHDGTFREQGVGLGIALPPEGTARSGMGIDAGDWNGVGRESLVIGNFATEMMSLYEPDVTGVFTDAGRRAGVNEPSRPLTTFGCLFLDLDNDGWLDIAAANGHIDDKTEAGEPIPLHQRPLFLHNQSGKSFREARLFDRALVGRGLATGDLNRDGAADLVLTQNGGAPVLLRNSGHTGNSVRLVLEGVKSNRSAIGTLLEAHVGSHVLRRWVRSGSSYLSASELPVTIGIGSASGVDSVTVHWPRGQSESLPALAAGREYHIREGSGVTGNVPLQRSTR